eukprot:TRINITY_DN12310_c0_g1_i1.p1 TRINITY_DN12310_c0_g1~~TRINITY_DN12310_c0_g1_i1.p1  ORF type:complete len:225 (-),score=39.50 TRINITY_DN12310_c0_g1_i1:44-637(-)
MESSPYLRITPFTSPHLPSFGKKKSVFVSPTLRPRTYHRFQSQISASKTPRGFGPSLEKMKKKKKSTKRNEMEEEEKEEDEDEEEGEGDEDTIPEIVTNRMMSRMGFSVGVPLGIGLMFFPLFYYLKVVVKLDVPNWVPFLVSFFFFGSALLGVSYGIVSSSWDPSREGSLLGWNEAQKNWPVFWQSLWGGNRTRKQ